MVSISSAADTKSAASSTGSIKAALLATISALMLLANQHLRAGMKDRVACLNGQRLKIGEGLAPTLTGISAAGLLHHLLERFRKITALKCCHPKSQPMERSVTCN